VNGKVWIWGEAVDLRREEKGRRERTGSRREKLESVLICFGVARDNYYYLLYRTFYIYTTL
jgi:hypothetical protein